MYRKPVNDPVISSLAILKFNWDLGHDYIDNFVPFAAEALRISPQSEVSLPDLQATIFDIFGLRIPQGALKTILRRAVRSGYATRTEGIYRRNDAALQRLNIAPIRADVLRRHEALVGKLLRFCRENYRIDWSQEDAETALLAFIQDHSTPILAVAIEGYPLFAADFRDRRSEYLIGAFIAHLCERDPEGFEFLETIVKGNMLANVLLYPDLGGIQQRFDKVEVYFDTTFLLRALGFTDPHLQAPCKELLDLLYELNASLRCFEHTYREMQRVLDAAAHALGSLNGGRQRYFEVFEHFRSLGYSASDAEHMLASLERRLSTLRVQIKASPPHKAPLGVNEIKLRSILKDVVGYSNDDALEADVASLTSIYRLRNGQFPTQIEASDFSDLHFGRIVAGWA